MIKEKHIRKMAELELKGSDNYLVSVLVKPGNKIMVFIDNDNDVSVDDCVKLSRAIEGQLDRDSEDFELMVSSAGLDQPFSLSRQFKKYINRKINIQLEEGNRFDAILTAFDEESITFKKLIKKGKSKKLEEGPEQRLSLKEIKETRPGIQF
jgi:ribosome maturation factor RimP